MNKFLALTVFTRVTEQGGFTAGARKLGMSVSAVTKTIARLEDEIGTQLFNRTTRRLSTTDYGQEFYERAVRILAELEEAETAVRSGNIEPRGRLRAVVPFSFGRVTLVPALPSFLSKFPGISIELHFSDGPVDLIAEGYDIAVRTGHITDSRLMTRMLTRSRQLTVASPAFLAEYGVPETPDDLKRFNCIVGRFGPEWKFRGPEGREVTVRVSGNAVINSGDVLREAAAAGLGLVQGTEWLFRKDLAQGAVQSVLDEFTLEGTAISVLYSPSRHMPKKVRVFLDFLVDITKNPALVGQHE